jgi:peptidoglycan hydrolase-like protein with peptidoglycan-binding domain
MINRWVLAAGAAAASWIGYKTFKKPTASDFQTSTTIGPGGVPLKVATPVSDGVTVPQATGTPIVAPKPTPPGGAVPVPTSIPGKGVVYAPPNTIQPAPGGGVFQIAPIVITPTGAASVAVGSVSDVQKGLNTLGYCKPPLVEDGKLGPLTTACIKAFQSKNGLVVDGTAGPATKAAMSAALSALAGSGSGPGATAQQSNPASGVATTPTGQTIDTTPALKMTAKDVQHALNVTGTSPTLVEDGQIGPKSVAAIKSFQTAHGLTPDGIAGPKTKTALYLAVIQATSQPMATGFGFGGRRRGQFASGWS